MHQLWLLCSSFISTVVTMPDHQKEALGHSCRHHFYLADGFTNFNHGSYGSVTRPVAQYQRTLFERQEAYPDLFFRKEYRELLKVTRAKMAAYVHCDPESRACRGGFERHQRHPPIRRFRRIWVSRGAAHSADAVDGVRNGPVHRGLSQETCR
mmetsp:Transcript_18374/g.52453  ORF Transcript_18374/g.52453 Transcript_18374/m.52453 type:complete len:153 (+) Transcript_18374:127-585(+)